MKLTNDEDYDDGACGNRLDDDSPHRDMCDGGDFDDEVSLELYARGSTVGNVIDWVGGGVQYPVS